MKRGMKMGLVNNQKAYDQYLIWWEDYGNIFVHGKPVGYRFQIRIPNFRGNYLSCIEKLSFTLDGEEIRESEISMLLNNKRFLLSELPELYKEYWNVDDFATIEIQCEGGLQRQHKIGALMKLRYGYSAYFGKCKVVVSKCEREFDFGDGGDEK